MIIKRISLDQAADLHLVPVAAIGVPTGKFLMLGIEFDHASDDMDEFDIAAFTLVGKGSFALLHYRNSPDPDTTLMVEERLANETAFIPLIKKVASKFDISPSAFYWRSNGEVVRAA